MHAATPRSANKILHITSYILLSNRDIIQAVHDKTSSFINYETGDSETNITANLLIAFEEEDYIDRHISR